MASGDAACAPSQSGSRRILSKRASSESFAEGASGASSGGRTARDTRQVASGTLIPGAVPSDVIVSPHCISLETPSVDLMDNTHVEHAHRKSRRVKRWLAEQQRMSDSSLEGTDTDRAGRVINATGTPCNPYLAYPNMGHRAVVNDIDNGSLHSYVIVEEDDVREARDDHDSDAESGALEYPEQNKRISSHDLKSTTFSSAPARRASTMRPPRPSSLPVGSPWRGLPFAKTLPHRPVSIPGPLPEFPTPPQTPKKNIPTFRRRSPIPEEFRSLDEPATPKSGRMAPTLKAAPETPKASMRFRLSSLVRSYGSSPSVNDSNSPRPSTSTSSATSTAVDKEELTGTARLRSKISFTLSKATKLSSLGRNGTFNAPYISPSRSSFISSTQTFSTPSIPSQHENPSFLVPPVPTYVYSSGSKRQPHSVFHGGNNASSSALSTLSIASIGSSIGGRNNILSSVVSSKRKKLVVSGIEADDIHAIEGLQRWCERFGELRQVTRMPNGDLQVDFKRAEVADTVCRISAQVYISGVGSVHLSWITGKKR